MRIDKAETIRSDEPQAVTARDVYKLGLPCRALRAGFGEIRGEDYAATHSRRAAFGDRGRKMPRRHREKCDVNGTVSVADLGTGGDAKNFLRVRIDGHDTTGVAVFDQEVHHAAAELG